MNDVDFFNSIAEKWDQIAVHDKAKLDFIMRKAHIKPQDSVLDLGCGTGVLLPVIKKQVNPDGKITALDISHKMLEIAERKNGVGFVEYVCCNFYEYDKKNEFDLIVAYSCFPHFKDRARFFLKSNAILQDKGRLLIAHSEGRSIINNMHSEISHQLTSDALESAADVVKMAKLYGFSKIEIIDTDELFLVLVEKAENCQSL